MSIKTVLPQTVFVVVLVICSAFASRAWAWGELKVLDGYERHALLIYPAYQNHKIDYCLNLRDPAPGKFSYSSMEIEVPLALQQWLNAVKNWTGPVKIKRVSCSTPGLNLMVDVGPPPPHNYDPHQAFQYIVLSAKNAQVFDHVVLSTTYSYYHDNAILFDYDFAYVVRDLLKTKHITLQKLIKRITKHQTPFKTIATWVEPQWGDQSDAMVFNSSYYFLLHEFGHAFGLCDTNSLGIMKQECDPKYVSNWYSQPPSVMGNGSFYYLTADDISGVHHVFSRFSYLAKK